MPWYAAHSPASTVFGLTLSFVKSPFTMCFECRAFSHSGHGCGWFIVGARPSDWLSEGERASATRGRSSPIPPSSSTSCDGSVARGAAVEGVGSRWVPTAWRRGFLPSRRTGCKYTPSAVRACSYVPENRLDIFTNLERESAVYHIQSQVWHIQESQMNSQCTVGSGPFDPLFPAG